MKTTPCAACKRPLIFATLRDADGQPILHESGPKAGRPKVIPLDARSPVYEAIEDIDTGQVVAVRARTCYVSHYATCTDPNRFSGK